MLQQQLSCVTCPEMKMSHKVFVVTDAARSSFKQINGGIALNNVSCNFFRNSFGEPSRMKH